MWLQKGLLQQDPDFSIARTLNNFAIHTYLLCRAISGFLLSEEQYLWVDSYRFSCQPHGKNFTLPLNPEFSTALWSSAISIAFMLRVSTITFSPALISPCISSSVA